MLGIGKKEETKQTKSVPKPVDVYYFCNACGDKFKVERADQRFCTDVCRAAAHSVCRGVLTAPHNIQPEEALRYDNISIKLKDSSGIVKRTLFQNDGTGTFSEVKKELTKTGEEGVFSDEIKDPEPAIIKKQAPKPKNDKNLIPGDKGKPFRKKKSKKK